MAASYHILTYRYVPDIMVRRGPYRDTHLQVARQKATEGKLLLGGAAGDPIDKGVLIWKDVSIEVKSLSS